MKYLLTANGLSLRKLYGPGKQQDKCPDSISASFLGTRVMVPTEEFRPWANRSYNPGSLGTIYSAGLLGRSLLKLVFPALSNSKQLFTALGHLTVYLSICTNQYPGSHWMHRLKHVSHSSSLLRVK